MIADINLPLILLAALVAVASPSPATLAIAGTSMNSGRRMGLTMASGVSTGSLIWSISAAFGLGAVMLAHEWLFQGIRVMGACYLLFLAWKSARSALSPTPTLVRDIHVSSPGKAFTKGLALHLTNPKAVLFFGALFSIGLPIGTPPASLVLIITAVGLQSMLVFHAYALLFSSAAMIAGYTSMRRGFEAAFAVVFGVAGVKVLLARGG